MGGSASVTPAQVKNGSSDNCSPLILSLSKTGFDCGNSGPNPVILTVKDVTGNTSTCNAVVNVIGEIPVCSINVVPANSTYTGGVPTNIYLGYGPQSATINVTAMNGAPFT